MKKILPYFFTQKHLSKMYIKNWFIKTVNKNKEMYLEKYNSSLFFRIFGLRRLKFGLGFIYS